jgi:1D-myo-inositol 3-kinase
MRIGCPHGSPPVAGAVPRHISTGPTARVNGALHYDYTTVGHVTIDVLEDGSRQAGGAAFYSALQAARLGLRALIVTRGLESEIEQALERYRDELHVQVLPARNTTTLQTSGYGSHRVQRMLAWAGPIAQDIAVDSTILHFAPVARESPSRWRGQAAFVGLTPQGLVRDWSGPRKQIRTAPPTRAAARGAMLVAEQCQAVVVSEHERASCAGLIARASAAGAVIAITAGERPNTIVGPNGTEMELCVPAIARPCDDLGAGDVFAAAFFIALADGRRALDAARFANAAAAVRMSGVSAGADAIGGLAEIEARLAAVDGAGG